ncbi:MAG TPA: hypothetical protein VKU84_13620 [Stellaceae bacterium]|nr:hypothetical protein [Stellaceae bacterium]
MIPLLKNPASFDSRPSGAAQDEGGCVLNYQMLFILSRPRSGRVEGRAMAGPI